MSVGLDIPAIVVLFYLLENGDMYWTALKEPECIKVEQALIAGKTVEVEVAKGKRIPIKAARCFEVDSLDDVYGVQMKWLREE